MKKLLVVVALQVCCFSLQTGFSQNSRTQFAEFALFSTSFGADNDWEGDRQIRWEHTYFWDQRAGISISRRVYAGLLVQIIRAGNFEQIPQAFYTAGLWSRYYFIQPFSFEWLGRWGLYAETGLQTGNFTFETRDFIRYYEGRPGQFYFQGRFGGEFRIWKNLSIESALQFLKPINGSWDQYGSAYFNLGLSWRPQRH